VWRTGPALVLVLVTGLAVALFFRSVTSLMPTHIPTAGKI
jgi:hypothetical protein